MKAARDEGVYAEGASSEYRQIKVIEGQRRREIEEYERHDRGE